MRKIIFQEWLSLEGFAADGDNGTSFLESAELNKYSDKELLDFMDGIETILLGANTYRLFVDFWPTATTDQEIIADKLNSTPKIIFSKSLKKAPWGKWPEANIVQTDAIEYLNKAKSQPGKNMVLWGSISLAQSLMKKNLIDEYHLRICPIVLGSGRPLFESMAKMNLELIGTKQYSSGLVLLKYRPAIH